MAKRSISVKSVFIVVAAVSVSLMTAGLVVAEVKAPQIVLPETSYDFGSVPQGSKVVHDFVVRNAGNAELTIQRISPSCGCTATTLSSPVIQPGASETLRVEFNTAGFSGNKTKTVHLLTNSREKPEVYLKLTGTIARGVTVEPERLDFGELTPSSSVGSRTQEFAVSVADGSSLSIAGAKSFSKLLTVSPISVTPTKARFAVEVQGDLPKGELRDRVLIEFQNDQEASVNVPVTASMKADLRMIPATVSFGIVDGTDVIERRIRFENSSKAKVEIEKIVSSHPAVSGSIVDVHAGKQGVLVLKLDPRKVQGDLRASVDVFTSHPIENKLSVSVFGVQPPR